MARRPVLLIPGWSDRARVLRPLRQHLIGAGWPADWVAAVDFRDRYGSNREHAAEIAQQIVGLAVRSPDQAVDLVAHSMGGLAARHLLGHFPEASRVRRLITLGTPHAGTYAAWLAWGGGSAEMKVRSEFITSLPSPPHSFELIGLHTPFDLRIFPGKSAVINGGRNYRVWCLGHRRLIRSRKVFDLLTKLLNEE